MVNCIWIASKCNKSKSFFFKKGESFFTLFLTQCSVLLICDAKIDHVLPYFATNSSKLNSYSWVHSPLDNKLSTYFFLDQDGYASAICIVWEYGKKVISITQKSYELFGSRRFHFSFSFFNLFQFPSYLTMSLA